MGCLSVHQRVHSVLLVEAPKTKMSLGFGKFKSCTTVRNNSFRAFIYTWPMDIVVVLQCSSP